jgi:hypothetical protein
MEIYGINIMLSNKIKGEGKGDEMRCIECGEEAVALVEDEFRTTLKYVKNADAIITKYTKGLCKKHFEELKNH